MGTICTVTEGQTLIAICWPDRMAATFGHLARHRSTPRIEAGPVPPIIALALTQYFEGAPAGLAHLSIEPPGTEFQRTVWSALRTVPFGAVVSYAHLARLIDRPRAIRAVANANGRNPLPIVIPCHRVIASNGTIGGFSSGIDRKKWLLQHESSITD